MIRQLYGFVARDDAYTTNIVYIPINLRELHFDQGSDHFSENNAFFRSTRHFTSDFIFWTCSHFYVHFNIDCVSFIRFGHSATCFANDQLVFVSVGILSLCFFPFVKCLFSTGREKKKIIYISYICHFKKMFSNSINTRIIMTTNEREMHVL